MATSSPAPRDTSEPPSADASQDAGRNFQAVGRRAVVNTLYRSGGEVVGRLASLLLFAVTARSVGESGLGALVFALAFLGFGMIAVDLGLDRYFLRLIVREADAGDRLFFNILALKASIAVPLFGASLVGLHLVGYDHRAQAACWALAPGVFVDSVARTQLAVFLAHERGGPPSLADALQRVSSAALGIIALRAGYGVVAVAATYSIGSTVGMIAGFVLMRHTIGVPAITVGVRSWPALIARSVSYAAQDVFTVMLARIDAVLLAVITTQAIVGRYGAAYRMFDSSLLVTYALAGAFSAMFTYLGRDSRPTLGWAYQSAIKLAVVALTPVAVALACLAAPVCRLIFGPAFISAGVPLRLLAPAVVLSGVIALSTSLMVSRGNPRRLVVLTASMALVNVLLNLVLITLEGSTGAAVAMLATEALYGVCVVRMVLRETGSIDWRVTVTGGLTAGVAMSAVCLLLRGHLWVALGGGALTYLGVLLGTELLVSPADVRSILVEIRRRLAPASTP